MLSRRILRWAGDLDLDLDLERDLEDDLERDLDRDLECEDLMGMQE